MLGAGLVAPPLAALLRLPVMLVLLAAGLAIGPHALDLVRVEPGSLGAQLVFTFGVALILFHGGLGISAPVIRRTAIGLGLLVLPGVLLTSLVVALVAGPVFGVGFTVALLIGAVLAPTDPAILIPLFARMRLRPKVAQTVVAESAFNDPIGTVLALTVASALGTAGGTGLGDAARDFAVEVALGALVGLAGGALLVLMLSDSRLGLWREAPLVAVLAVLAVDYVETDRLGGSAFLAAFVMGLVVGNAGAARGGAARGHRWELERTVAQAAELAALAVFVILGVNLPLDALREHLAGGLLVMAVFVFVARPLTVAACLGLDRRGGWTRREILFVGWCRETGVVPAALAALLLARGVEGAELATAMVALAIVTTLLLQATTAAPLARRLGLLEEPLPAEIA